MLPIGAHWSSLELKIINEGFVESIGIGGVDGVGEVRTEIFTTRHQRERLTQRLTDAPNHEVHYNFALNK